jgi:hypothetical protein
MEALLVRCAILAAAFASLGASYRTPNFIVEAPSAQMAKQVGNAAEKYRRDLAVDWLGKEMPNWSQPCPITAQIGEHLGAGGATSFVFEHGEVFGWRMNIQGSLVRILDSVLPHEVTHTIFATHFRQPLPRWADEGACTTVEHPSEKAKQQMMLVDFLHTGRAIAFNRMFAMKDYPQDVMPLYSQGYSLARYLIAQGGKRKFLSYVADGMADENWTRVTKKHYGVVSLAALQNNWLDWVRQGSPAIDAPQDNSQLVAVKLPGPSPERPRGDRAAAVKPGPKPEANGDTVHDEPGVYELASATKLAPKSDDDAPTGAEGKARGATASAASDSVEPALPDVSIAEVAQVGPVVDEPPVRASREAAAYQVTRPQAVQRPRQVILEWSRAPGGGAAQPTAEN